MKARVMVQLFRHRGLGLFEALERTWVMPGYASGHVAEDRVHTAGALRDLTGHEKSLPPKKEVLGSEIVSQLLGQPIQDERAVDRVALVRVVQDLDPQAADRRGHDFEIALLHGHGSPFLSVSQGAKYDTCHWQCARAA